MNSEPKTAPDNDLMRLLSDCLANKRRAQHKLFKRYYAQMFAVCMRYATNPDEAEDIVNEGFIKIFANLGKYEASGSFDAWLRKIMINSAIDYQRKYKTLVEKVEYDAIDEMNFAASENDALSKMRADDLIKMIQELPAMSRTVFNLYVFEGFSHQEIAQQLNIKEGTSFWHLNNARTILKEKIRKTTEYDRF